MVEPGDAGERLFLDTRLFSLYGLFGLFDVTEILDYWCTDASEEFDVFGLRD